MCYIFSSTREREIHTNFRSQNFYFILCLRSCIIIKIIPNKQTIPQGSERRVCDQRRHFITFKTPRNRFQGIIDSASLCSLEGLYDNSIPTRFLAPVDCYKIPALAGRYDNPIPTRFLAPIDYSKISAQL
jgi:hypothetical protein